MTDADLPPRPRQLLVAAGVVIGGSVFLVAAVFDALTRLQSVDMREQLQQVVSSSAGRNLGVTLDQAVSAMRAALGLTAVCAAVAAVLGVFVLQRHRGARLGLSIVAVPLLVTAPLVGGFLGAVVAVATLMLWNGPAGDWFAGRPIRESGRAPRPDRTERPSPEEPPSPSPPPYAAPFGTTPEPPPTTRDTSTTPDPTQGFGGAGEPVAPPPGPVAAPWAAPAPVPGWSPGTAYVGPVPGQVKMACILTWVFSGTVALLYLVALGALVVDRQSIVDRVVDSPAWRDAGLANDLLVPMLWLGVLLFLAWSIGAIVLAWFAWRRHNWARYLLAASAVLTLLVGAVAFPVGLAHQIACALAAGGLFAPRSRAWYAGRQSPTQPPAPPRPPW